MALWSSSSALATVLLAGTTVLAILPIVLWIAGERRSTLQEREYDARVKLAADAASGEVRQELEARLAEALKRAEDCRAALTELERQREQERARRAARARALRTAQPQGGTASAEPPPPAAACPDPATPPGDASRAVPRLLSMAQLQQIATAAKGLPHPVAVNVRVNIKDQDGHAVAEQLAAALRAAGWHVDGMSLWPLALTSGGLMVKGPNPTATSLTTALRAAGLPVDMLVSEGTVVYLEIGAW